MIRGFQEYPAVVTAYLLGCAIDKRHVNASLTEEKLQVEVYTRIYVTLHLALQSSNCSIISQTLLEVGSMLIARSSANTYEAQVCVFNAKYTAFCLFNRWETKPIALATYHVLIPHAFTICDI